MKDVITTQQAADKWGVKQKIVIQWIDRGRLKAQKFGPVWMIPANAEKPKDKRLVENPVRNRRKTKCPTN